MDNALVHGTVERAWEDSILTSLSELITIPALSPNFDVSWESAGHLDAAVEHVRRWLVGRGIEGATAEILRLPGRTPVLLFDVPAGPSARPDAGTVLLYGHLDKQPPVGGWSSGLGPWTPVLRDGRLYGRGAADDGYSGYAATAAIEAVQAAGGAHARCLVLLETSEESGSPDLPAYLAEFRPRFGDVSLVVCLDSGGQDYDRLWLTTSLRGMVGTTLTVRVLETGLHSGLASGIVPSSFRIIRQLLDRLEDSATGEILIPELHGEIPEERMAEINAFASAAPGSAAATFPMVPGMRPVSDDDVELMLNNSWRPTLSVVGAAGMPLPDDAGAVLRPETTLRLSFRLPPSASPQAALDAVTKALTTDVPYGAQVILGDSDIGLGWNMPPVPDWLRTALDQASETVFDGNEWRSMLLGGGIPFMGMMAQAYPDARFVVTGALGADSNAHVPDEWLHIAQAKRVTEAVALILDAHARG
jgi:acetylornithine deacetylase/succinyl-diaminopimelate desuccinylase-like protein